MTDNALRFAARGERELRTSRTFDAPRESVFAHLTEPKRLKRWMYGFDGTTLPICESDLRVGGSLRCVWRGPDGAEMGMRGEYREIEPPRRLVHTELYDEDWTGGETVVTTELSEADGVTTLTLTIAYPKEEARNAALASPMSDGLAASYARLDGLLSAGS